MRAWTKRVEEEELAVPIQASYRLTGSIRAPLGKIPHVVQGLCTWLGGGGSYGWASWSLVNLLKLYVQSYIFQGNTSIASFGFSWRVHYTK